MDQLSKIAVRHWLYLGQRITVINGFFDLTHFENRGAAFSWMEGHRVLLLVLSVMALAVAFYYLISQKKAHVLSRIAVALIVAGGIGNLIDRAIRGSVTDMISISFFPPIFNIADISVCIGCALLFFYVIFIAKEE